MRQLKEKTNLLVLLLTIFSLSFCTALEEATSTEESSTSSGTTTTTSTDNSEGPFFLWSSGYEKLGSEESGAWFKTFDDGYIYVAGCWSGGATDCAGEWDYGYFETDTQDKMEQRNQMGKQWQHNSAITDAGSRIYINVKAPQGAKYDLSSTDTLVVQMGNAAASNANSHNTFTVTVNGGSQASDYSWSNSCAKDQAVTATHAMGMATYSLTLSDFTCSSGNLAGALAEAAEVMVSVEPGKNTSADASTSNNATMIVVGWIAFHDSSATPTSTNTSKQVIFSTNYQKETDGGDSTVKAKSGLNGTLRAGSGGNFGYGGWGVWENSDMNQRQGFGVQWQQTGTTPDGNSYIYYTVKAPNNGSVNVSKTSKLAIQIGNGYDISGGQGKTHEVFTLEINGGTYDTSSYTWSLSCSKDVTIGANAISNTNAAYGLTNYMYDLSSFTCSSGTVTDLKQDVKEVAVKVIGGKNSDNDTETNHLLLPMVGFIGFNSGD